MSRARVMQSKSKITQSYEVLSPSNAVASFNEVGVLGMRLSGAGTRRSR